MNKIKNVLYGVAATGLGLVPLAVSAQLIDPWTTGYNNAAASGVPRGTLSGIVKFTMDWLLGLLGFLGIIGFVISGILYLTAAGDEKLAEQAKEAMKYSIIGVVVALLGFVVIQAVNSWLQGNNAGF